MLTSIVETQGSRGEKTEIIVSDYLRHLLRSTPSYMARLTDFRRSLHGIGAWLLQRSHDKIMEWAGLATVQAG